MPAHDSPHPHLRVQTNGAVRTITLHNPQRKNAQTPSLWSALAAQAAVVPDDVRVVVLRGSGGVFSAGIDVNMFTSKGVAGEESPLSLVLGGEGEPDAAIARYQRGFTAWAECPAVVVAVVEGYAIGAGFQLALAADLRIAANDAKFAMRETSLGLVPDLAGTRPLVRLVGYSRALELCATGRFVTGEEAGGIGLVNAAFDPGDLDLALERLVETLLAAPATALRALKPLLRSAEQADTETQLAAERAAQIPLMRDLVGRLR